MTFFRSMTKAYAVCWIASILILGALFSAFFVNEKISDFKSRLAASKSIHAEYKKDVLRADVETALRIVALESSRQNVASAPGRPMSASAKRELVERQILDTIAAARIGRGDKGDILVVSHYGALLLNPYGDLFGGQNVLRLGDGVLERLLEDARRPEGSFTSLKAPSGVNVMLYARRIDMPSWIVCAAIPDSALASEISESASELKSKLAVDLSIILFAAAVAIGGALWLSRSVSKAVRREIIMLVSYCRGSTGAKEKLSVGEFFFDEFRIIASSLASLARSVDSLVGTVKGLALRAESGSQAKSGFIDSLRVEMSSPVNGILDMVRILKDSHLDMAQRECVGAIDVSAQALSRLSCDLREFSVDEAGRLQIIKRPFAMVPLLEELAGRMEPLAKEAGDILKLEIPDDCKGFFVGDGGKIAQCLQTLVANALKFTKDGSVTLGVSRAGNVFEFKVADTGLGISQGKLKGIFEFAGDSRFSGVSLGLAVARGMVEAMGGTMGASSEKHHGSIFSFKLNLEEA